MEHNSIGDEALAELLRAVAARGALRQLRLGSNAFTADAANTLAAHLVAFPAGPLRSVGLANNAVGGGGDALVRRSARTLLSPSLTRGHRPQRRPR